MNTATLQLVLEAKDLASPALERLRAGARGAWQEGGRAAQSLHGLNRAGGGLAPAAASMERLRDSMRDMAKELPETATRASRAFADLRRQALDPGLASMTAMQRGARRLREALQTPFPAGAPAAGVQRFQAGGAAFPRLQHPLITRGSGSADDVPAMLMRGEFVLRRDAVAKYGLDFLHALNGMRLPAMPFQAVPRFAAGGLAVPPQYLDLIPRFAEGGQVGGFSASGYTADRFLANARPLRDILEQFSKQTAAIAERIGLGQLANSPAEYLSGALGIVTDTVEVFKKEPLTIPEAVTTTGQASQELENKKNLLQQQYQQKIDIEKSRGNDALANALEMQRLELTDMIANLQMLLEDLAYRYREAVERAALEAESSIDELHRQWQEERAELERMLTLQSGTVGGQSGYSGMYNHIAAQNRTRIYERRIQSLDRGFFRDATREERRAESAIRGEERAMERQASQALRQGTLEGVSAERMGALGLRETYQEYLYAIQEMEAEFAARLQELYDEYGNVQIGGFSHWLSRGGPVGFAKGGVVPHFAWAAPGSDSVPAMLTPGEFVLRREAVQALGAGVLERLNSLGDAISGSLRPALAFASGGLVPGGDLAGALQPTARQAHPTPGADWGTLTLRIGEAGHQVLAEREVARALRKTLERQARTAT